VGFAVTREIERRYDGDRQRALEGMSARVARALGVARIAKVQPRLAPVAALIPDLARWSPGDKRRLAAALLAKEGRREGAFMRAMLRAERFTDFLTARFGGLP
jgi:hypothetical protein